MMDSETDLFAVGAQVERGVMRVAPEQATGQLGPLPEARWLWHGSDRSRPDEDSYSADQMRDYAAKAVHAERERCANLCDQRSADHWHDYTDKASHRRGSARAEAESDEAEACAATIRGPNVNSTTR